MGIEFKEIEFQMNEIGDSLNSHREELEAMTQLMLVYGGGGINLKSEHVHGIALFLDSWLERQEQILAEAVKKAIAELESGQFLDKVIKSAVNEN